VVNSEARPVADGMVALAAYRRELAQCDRRPGIDLTGSLCAAAARASATDF